MKTLKTVGLIAGILLALFLLAAVLLPYIFRDDIEKLAEEQVAQRINAELSFEDVRISLFRDFPHISLIVNRFQVMGVDKFEGLELMSGDKLAVSINLFSLLSKSRPLEIVSVSLARPRAHLVVLNDGSANYDILRETQDNPASDSARENTMVIDLKRYSISNGSLIYEDRPNETYLSLLSLDHSGSGNFSGEVFDLDTETQADTAIFRQGGITYLHEANLDWDAVLQVDRRVY
jgi:uncharacterized protein involved in outer membrane biogenesis